MGIKNRIYIHRHNILANIGWNAGLIQPFPDEVMKRLENCYYYGTPMNVFLASGADLSQEKCYDRSYGITMAFDKFNLIRGDLMNYAKTSPRQEHDPNFGHGWMESDGWVYDTTFNIRVKKWFYKIWLGAKESARYSQEELFQDEDYMKLKNTTKEDVEGDCGLMGLSAWLTDEILKKMKEDEELQSSNSKIPQEKSFHSKRAENLSHLIVKTPKIDFNEYSARQTKRLQEVHIK